MNTIKKVSSIGIPVIMGLGFAWIGNRIIRNESKLENRELELKLKLESKTMKTRN